MHRIHTITTYIVLLFMLLACSHHVENAEQTDSLPPIYPDYIGVTIPCNIAPLNFGILDTDSTDRADHMQVTLKGSTGEPIIVEGEYADFPIDRWQQLLRANAGDSIMVSVVAEVGGKPIAYRPFPIHISKDTIDYGVTYRRIAPGYEVYSKMGIYERSLNTFEEKAIVENSLITGMCVNCHTVCRTNPAHQSLHIRGEHGGTMLITPSEGAEYLHTKTDTTLSQFVYPYWHPTGKYIAYSTNKTKQYFHEGRDKRIEVADVASDILIYSPSTHAIITSPLLQGDEAFETFPAFSADGRTLYFCRADARSVPEQYKDVKYDICSIAFDPATAQFGDHIDTLIHASAEGKNAVFPRPSYDGRFLMYTLSDYGTFPIWHKEADLRMVDLLTNEDITIDILNSDDTESFHNWSSTSRWVVLSSRRDDGLYTRLYFSHIDEKGRATKPFMLPQSNPARFYRESIYSYNVPDFITSPVIVPSKKEMKEGLGAN